VLKLRKIERCSAAIAQSAPPKPDMPGFII